MIKYIFGLLVPDIVDLGDHVTLGHLIWLSEKVERERLKMDLGVGIWCLKIYYNIFLLKIND